MRTNAPRFTGTRFHFLGQPCQEENKVQQIKTSSLKSLSSRDQLGKGQKLPNKLQQLYGDEGKFGTDTCSHDVLMCFYTHTDLCTRMSCTVRSNVFFTRPTGRLPCFQVLTAISDRAALNVSLLSSQSEFLG